jgi:hypothetical protein
MSDERRFMFFAPKEFLSKNLSVGILKVSGADDVLKAAGNDPSTTAHAASIHPFFLCPDDTLSESASALK